VAGEDEVSIATHLLALKRESSKKDPDSMCVDVSLDMLSGLCRHAGGRRWAPASMSGDASAVLIKHCLLL
jgi:hypothetical protein